MKKDIDFPPVEGVQMAIARRQSKSGDFDWYTYLLNQNDFALENVLITAKGYGPNEGGNEQKTSVLRHVIGHLGARDFTQVERIVPEVFHLYNEYWLSYYVKEQIYDKKFIFVPESIVEANFIKIDMLALEGVLHL